MEYKDISEKQPFQFVGTTVYQLEFDSWRKGEAQMRNRVYAQVYGYRDTPKEELEATARLFAGARDMLEALIAARRELELYANDSGEDYNNPTMNSVIAKAQGEAE